MSNLSKFVVIGSEQEIINKIKDHFDINKTAPSKPYGYLIDEIPSAINIAKAGDFFSQLDQALKGNKLALSRRVSFWKGVLGLRQDIASEASIFITPDFDLVVDILKQDHSKSSFFTEPTFTRELWKKHIIDEYSKAELSLLIYFINNLIPADQVEEAQNKLLSSLLYISAFQSPLQDEPEIKLELKNPVYKLSIKKLILDKVGLNYPNTYRFWGTENASLVLFYLKEFGIDKSISLKLHETFSARKYPYALRDALKRFFSEEEAVHTNFISYLTAEGLSVPFPIDITAPVVPIAPLPPPPPLNPSS